MARRGFGNPRLHDVNMAAWIARHAQAMKMRVFQNRIWGFSTLRAPFLGVPVIRIMVWGLFWVPPILGTGGITWPRPPHTDSNHQEYPKP